MSHFAIAPSPSSTPRHGSDKSQVEDGREGEFKIRAQQGVTYQEADANKYFMIHINNPIALFQLKSDDKPVQLARQGCI